MREALGFSEQSADVKFRGLGKRGERIENALFGRLRGREGLFKTQPAGAVDLHQVSEGAAGVDAEVTNRRLLRHQACCPLAVGSTCDRVPQVASVPPSTRRSIPVMNDASSDTRNSTALAWSCG